MNRLYVQMGQKDHSILKEEVEVEANLDLFIFKEEVGLEDHLQMPQRIMHFIDQKQVQGLHNTYPKLQLVMEYSLEILVLTQCYSIGIQYVLIIVMEQVIKDMSKILCLLWEQRFTLEEIQQQINYRIILADKIIVSGCSAGGAASFTWVQTIRDLLPIGVTVLHVPDSGIFMDTSTYDGSLPYQNTYHKNFMQLSNKEISPPNTSCILANKNQQWKCLLAEYLIEYINVPIFFVQSPYDSWSIPNVLKVTCPKDGNLSNCNDNQMNFIENYAITMEVMMKSRLSTYQNTGVFAPSCLEHCFLESSNFYGNKFQVPSGSGNTIANTLSAWILDQKSSNYLDNVPWPENKGCNNLKTYII